ncbi:MAG: Bro-N domain-containing protein [Tannerella sp.]|jgi:prophage antirepressor-like protein|nr:Bro-N domain-containing protein [Tannerella sp.]
MDDKTDVKLFETKRVRTAWNEDEEEWYFSVVDVVGILTDSPDPKRYWSVLKTRLKQEGIEGTTICSTLKLPAQDGKMRQTDVASTEQLFRIIQSIPSPKAEPFKQWLAQTGKERLDQLQNW